MPDFCPGAVARPCLSHWPTLMAPPVEVAGDVRSWSAVRDWTFKSREVVYDGDSSLMLFRR